MKGYTDLYGNFHKYDPALDRSIPMNLRLRTEEEKYLFERWKETRPMCSSFSGYPIMSEGYD